LARFFGCELDERNSTLASATAHLVASTAGEIRWLQDVVQKTQEAVVVPLTELRGTYKKEHAKQEEAHKAAVKALAKEVANVEKVKLVVAAKGKDRDKAREVVDKGQGTLAKKDYGKLVEKAVKADKERALAEQEYAKALGECTKAHGKWEEQTRALAKQVETLETDRVNATKKALTTLLTASLESLQANVVQTNTKALEAVAAADAAADTALFAKPHAAAKADVAPAAYASTNNDADTAKYEELLKSLLGENYEVPEPTTLSSSGSISRATGALFGRKSVRGSIAGSSPIKTPASPASRASRSAGKITDQSMFAPVGKPEESAAAPSPADQPGNSDVSVAAAPTTPEVAAEAPAEATPEVAAEAPAEATTDASVSTPTTAAPTRAAPTVTSPVVVSSSSSSSSPPPEREVEDEVKSSRSSSVSNGGASSRLEERKQELEKLGISSNRLSEYPISSINTDKDIKDVLVKASAPAVPFSPLKTTPGTVRKFSRRSIKMEGWLTYYATKDSQWAKSWVALEGGFLWFFATPADNEKPAGLNKPQSNTQIKGFAATVGQEAFTSPVVDGADSKPFLFTISDAASQPQYLCSVDDEDDRREWIQAITRLGKRDSTVFD